MDTRKGSEFNIPFQYGAQMFKLMLTAFLAISCVFLLNSFKNSHYFPIKKVRVYGVNHLDSKMIQESITPLVNRNFFNVNVDTIRNQLLILPWVADLNVRRVWPDEVEITIYEKNVLARWNDTQLLSDKGDIFTTADATNLTNLPKFSGPYGMQSEMIKNFFEANRLLIPLHAKISHLELTPYSTWKITLDNGINLQIGQQELLTRLDQFVRVYPKIVRNHAGIGVDYVDLRYPNGMAVRWKKPIKA